MKSILVTGSAGYVGHCLCKMLKEHGYYVIGIDPNYNYKSCYLADQNFSYYPKEGHWGHVIYPKLYGIFHLGASSLLNPSLKDPLSYYENNVGGLIEFLQILQRYEYKAPFIFASSAAVYGNGGNNIYETDEKEPINPYGSTKLMGEKIIQEASKITDFPYAHARFFNVVGSYDGVGQRKDQPHLLTALCNAGFDGYQEQFVQYGNNIRDYIHVRDVCSALIWLLEAYHLPKYEYLKMLSYEYGKEINIQKYRPYNGVFNVSTGIGTDTTTLVNAFKRITKTNFEVQEQGERKGDPRILVGNNEKIVQEIGWMPLYSSFGNIIESHWKHFKEQV